MFIGITIQIYYFLAISICHIFCTHFPTISSASLIASLQPS